MMEIYDFLRKLKTPQNSLTLARRRETIKPLTLEITWRLPVRARARSQSVFIANRQKYLKNG